MAATRFMRDLEIPLLEGKNSAAVDLFDRLHARKVLAAFGRSFGVLPQGEATPDQERFLDQAVTGLAQDGKVISVRLSLFAEMVKGRPWTPATFKEVGGTAGIGVTFLEETFSASTAPPEHRLHQKAARAVLKALLPEHGTDIKGNLRAHQELLQASGYARRPREFDDLLRILDGELRLVTPAQLETDRESGQESNMPDASGSSVSLSRYYQLTHDYLVPALRQWLTGKQRETWRGRAELRLAERAALWAAKPQNRYLPPWWEWANILLLTRNKDRTAPQRAMLRAATWRHLLQAGLLVLLLALLGGATWQWSKALRAEALVQTLHSAEIVGVPSIVTELSSYRRWAYPRLVQMAKGSPPDSRERLYAGLALLPWDPKQVDYLYQRLLTATPDEFMVIRDALLTEHSQQLVPRLWALLDTDADPARRFRAAIALGHYDSDNPKWAKLIDEVAQHVVTENPFDVLKFNIGTTAIVRDLNNSLIRIIRDPTRPVSERSQATHLLIRGMSVTTGLDAVRFELFLDAEGRPYDLLLPWVLTDPEVLTWVNKELAKRAAPEASEQTKDQLARRQAHAAAVLLQLDQREERLRSSDLVHAHDLWLRLRQGSDPRVRTFLLHRLGSVGVNPQTLLQQLDVERDLVARRALLLSLGGFAEYKLTAQTRQELATKLLPLYRDDPDPGIHAAIDWLLRLPQWDCREKLRAIDQQRAGQPPGNRGWYVTKRQGHTLAVVRDPEEFPMGSPATESDRQVEEAWHRKRIPRSFAIATKEVTVQQFREFLKANPGIRHDWVSTAKYSPDPDGPILGVTWFAAAQYCRWLSEQEGIPEEQMCYPRLDHIKEGMTLPADSLART
ncbi:MAG: SUMF1/EgtB/PvdO family nonheme iron enzyme, partial [Gemmataceae bacterium]|nr:SUMF1/EgtB/PvdO family nonheme iron enzyme [Gemmataceae bacterium]